MDRRAVVLAGILALAADSEANQPSLRSLPSCALSSLDGQHRFDLQQLQGAPLWVDFWASWCDSCAASFAFLESLERDFRAQGLKVLAINLDEDREAAQEFLARHPVGFQLARDAGGSCPRSFGVAGMPAAYLIDREGRIQYEHLGFRAGDADRLRGLVGELVASEPADPADPGPGPGE
jgi:thiol-disulfide isomerase/thioredoxin